MSSVSPSSPGQATETPSAAGSSARQPAFQRRLKALVLLSGTVRATSLSETLKRSVLDMPVDRDRSLLAHWQQQTQGLAEAFGLDRLPIRVLVNERTPWPEAAGLDAAPPVQAERDAGAYRGAGGVARDVASDYDDDDWLVLASGGQLLLQPLEQLLGPCTSNEGDVQLLTHRDGTPSGLTLVRCGALASISPVGFVDFKEQGLPQIAQHHVVRVIHGTATPGVAIRTRQQYLRALFRYHRAEVAESDDPFAETWQSTFSVIEPGAEVADSARVHDAVILREGRVGPGAVVTRSIVCDSAAVKPQARCVEKIVTRNGKR